MSLEAALAAASRGWYVFPCTGKQPRPGWRWARWNTTDPRLIREWWAAGGNVGIACGPSGLVVVDLDTGGTLPSPWDTVPGVVDGTDIFAVIAIAHDAPEWPDTRTVRTPRSGVHFYYQAGEYGVRNSAGQIGPMVDVRGDGGFVVGAGSVRDDGEYVLVNDADPAPLPEWLARLAVKAKPEQRPAARQPVSVPRSGSYVRRAIESEAAAVAAAPNGQRNNALNESAFKIARFVASGVLAEAEYANVMLDAARQCGLPDSEARTTIASALRGRST